MELEKYFKNRRTIRKYSSREVSDELLQNIIGQASHAPTTGNMQLYSVVVTRSKEGKEKLSPAHFNQPSVLGSSVVLTFCFGKLFNINKFSSKIIWIQKK